MAVINGERLTNIWEQLAKNRHIWQVVVNPTMSDCNRNYLLMYWPCIHVVKSCRVIVCQSSYVIYGQHLASRQFTYKHLARVLLATLKSSLGKTCFFSSSTSLDANSCGGQKTHYMTTLGRGHSYMHIYIM